MIPCTANFQTALAAYEAGKLIYVVAIQGYSRVFANIASLSGGVPGALVQPRMALDLETCAFDLPFIISGEFSGYSLPFSPSSVTKIEAVIFQDHLGGETISNGLSYVLVINGSNFSTGGPGASLGSSTTDIVVSPSATYPDPTTFPFSTVQFNAQMGANIIGTYDDQGTAGCALLVTYGAGQQVILLPTSFTVTGGSGSFGTGTVAESGISAPAVYFSPWWVSADDLSQTVNDLDGGADVGNLCFTVQDFQNLITADFPNFVFEGAQVSLIAGLPGLAGVDYCTLWTGFIDSVASANSNLEYYFSCLDTLTKLSQVIYQVADDGGITSGQNLRTVEGNPMSLLLDILENQIPNPDGTTGLDPSLIDTATMEAYRDGPFAGLEFLFHVNQPPNALDFIKSQIMKPLGGWIFCNALGQISVAFFYPVEAASPQMTLGPGNWTSIPEAEQTDMVNTVEFQFDKDDADVNASGNYDSDQVFEYQPSFAKYGTIGSQVIQADGLRSAFLGYFIATFVAWMTFYRYGFKNLKFDQYAAESLWPTMRLESGDVVDVTHPNIPDRAAGIMGITNKPFQILDKKWNFTEGRVTLTMIDATYLSMFGFFEIAPNGEADYTAASSADQGTYMFMTAGGKYSNGNPGNELG